MRVIVLALVVCLLAGCGSSSAPAVKTYHDSTYGFSFQYPAAWTAPKQGQLKALGGVQTYIVDVKGPNRNAQDLQLTLTGHFLDLPQFTNGEVRPDPAGGQDKFRYYHQEMAGHPAMEVQRVLKGQVDSLNVIANTKRHQYTVRMITGTPPFTKQATDAFWKVVHTLMAPKG